MQSALLLGLLALFSIWFLRKVRGLREILRGIDYLPGHRVIFSPGSLPHFLLSSLPYITLGQNRGFADKHSCFEDFGSDVISRVYAIPVPRADILIADADVIKEVTSSRSRFPKPVHLYKVLSLYGSNIVASEGEDWKKTRKTAAPAFSERNNRLVWDESVRVIDSLHNEVWKDKDVVSIDHFAEITAQITLFIIAMAGFGKHVAWQDAEAPPPKHKMSFKRTLNLMSVDIIFKIFLPERALGLTARTRDLRDAFHELKAYMLEIIAEYKQDTQVAGKHDLLSSLIDANNKEDGAGLTDSELTGNIFIFLLAGHETTAHALAYAFGLLALYQDEQERLYEHIKSVIPVGHMPTYDDMSKLRYATAVFNEALRMFPPVTNIPKCSQEDTFFTTKNSQGEPLTVTIPKGTYINISTPGLHYNPRYWKDPHKFNPSRFLGDWPRDAFLPFSGGPRACLGRRFAETEALAVLSYSTLRYKVTVTEEPQFAGETFERKKERVLRAVNRLTLTPVRLPLTFTRRV